jgi:hypothetical protein
MAGLACPPLIPARVVVTRGEDFMAARLLVEADAEEAGVRVRMGETKQEAGRWVFAVRVERKDR